MAEKKRKPDGEFKLPATSRRLRELAGFDPYPTREQWERESLENIERLRAAARRGRPD